MSHTPEQLAQRIGADFRNAGLLVEALTHRSYAYEQGLPTNNERLELLGDSVLNLIVTEMLYSTFPQHAEGDLAKLRASLVSTPALAEVATELGLGHYVHLGRGEAMTGGRAKSSIMADALEAVIGAVYLDRGLLATRRVIRNLFGTRVAAAVGQEVPRDPKTKLQEVVTRLLGSLPRYHVIAEGPDHAKAFEAEVLLGNESYGRGMGRSKKEAEQEAAREALARLDAERVEHVEQPADPADRGAHA